MADDATPHWSFVALSRAHDRTSFHSGVEALDEFLKNSARQNAEAGINRTVVAIRSGSTAISGFYTARMGEVQFAVLPEAERKRLPRYPVPVVHLARLAVDVRERGKGLGAELLMDSFARALRSSNEIAAAGIEVVAKDDGARNFYSKFGFRSLLDGDLHMYIAMKVVRAAFKR